MCTLGQIQAWLRQKQSVHTLNIDWLFDFYKHLYFQNDSAFTQIVLTLSRPLLFDEFISS